MYMLSILYRYMYLGSTISTGRDYPLAVRTELYAVDGITVPLVGEDTALSSDIPQLRKGVGERESQRREVHVHVQCRWGER